MFKTVFLLDLRPDDDVPQEVKDAILEYYAQQIEYGDDSNPFWFDTTWFTDSPECYEDDEDYIKVISEYLLSHNVTECYIST